MAVEAAKAFSLERAVGLCRSATRALTLGAFTLSMTQLYLAHRLAQSPVKRDAWRVRWVRAWAAGLLRTFGVARHIGGEPILEASGARLVVANHRSPLDIILMLELFGGTVLSRADLRGWPILGSAAECGGTIFVDRDDGRSGVRAIREMRRRLQAGQTVIVFPEGTTHRGDEVRPLLGGAFSAARGLDAEILPVGIAYEPGSEFVDESFTEHVARVAQRSQTRVGVCIGTPSRGGAHRDRVEMAVAVQRDLQALVAHARLLLPEAAR
jgi:1-acyl-sn-glycerol-3-phosphate acyltransferase